MRQAYHAHASREMTTNPLDSNPNNRHRDRRRYFPTMHQQTTRRDRQRSVNRHVQTDRSPSSPQCRMRNRHEVECRQPIQQSGKVELPVGSAGQGIGHQNQSNQWHQSHPSQWRPGNWREREPQQQISAESLYKNLGLPILARQGVFRKGSGCPIARVFFGAHVRPPCRRRLWTPSTWSAFADNFQPRRPR